MAKQLAAITENIRNKPELVNPVLVREVKTIIVNSSYNVKDYCRLQWEFV